MATRRQPEEPRYEGEQRRFDLVAENEGVGVLRERHAINEGAHSYISVEGQERALREPLRGIEGVRGIDHDRFFLAEKGRDGTYTVNLTEGGMVAFETALGIANDFGANTLISPHSTIADVMERSATREELSEELRRGDDGFLHWLRTCVLKRALRGSEKPSRRQRTISHIGKTIIVLLMVLWTVQQLAIVIGDLGDIPSILSNFTVDILHPTASTGAIGDKLSDAYTHLLLALVGVHLVYFVAKLIRPLARIYRKDQLVPGERPVVQFANWLLKKLTAERKREETRSPV